MARTPNASLSISYVAKCAAALPVLWLALFLIGLAVPGGHPPLAAVVALVPASLSLSGRAAGWFTGEPGLYSIGLTAPVVGTVAELAFVGAVAGVAGRRVSAGRVSGQTAWIACLLIYVAGHVFGRALVTSKPVTRVALSVGSPSVRHDVVRRIANSGDRSQRDLLVSALERGSEPDVDEHIIGALTSLEDGGFWHGYLTSARGSRWGTSMWAKVLCDMSNRSRALRAAPDVDFALLSASFAALNGLMFDRLVARLPDRPDLLNPIFRIGFNNPALGRARIDRLFELLQRPAIAKCVHLGMSSRTEWSERSHPKHRLYELATATCQTFTKADLELLISHYESPEESGTAPLNATGLCQFVIDTEGMDRKGRPR